jgi:hypothetical protein
MPLGFPVHQLGCDLQLLGVDRSFAIVRIGQIDHEHVQAVFAHLSSEVIQRSLRHCASLRMIRSTPSSRLGQIRLHVRRDAAVILGNQHVRNYAVTNATTGVARSAPMVRIPNSHETVFIRAQFHVDISRRAVPGELELQIPVKHEFHRTTGSLGDFRSRYAPVIGSELAAKAATDVLATNFHFIGRDPEVLGKLLVGTRHVLRR